MGKFWSFSKIGLTTPPPYLIFQKFLNFVLIWKMLIPPSWINFRHFWIWEHIDEGRPPRLTSWKGYWGIFTMKRVKLSASIFPFLGWGLKVTYNSDFFEKLRPPPWVFKCPNLNFRLFCFFSDPPPLLGKKAEIFPFFNYDASPKSCYDSFQGKMFLNLFFDVKSKSIHSNVCNVVFQTKPKFSDSLILNTENHNRI